MAAYPTKADLVKEIVALQKKIEGLKQDVIGQSAISAAKAGVVFLRENIDQIHGVDMDTRYGTVNFLLKR